ncbi:MAG: HypC/HybG/HupF family hydrogenase formation chaperone [Burkholderiales bacterium]
MCIGIPMQVVSAGDGRPWCEGRGVRRQLDTLLIGEQPPGTWVLAFRDSAIRVLTPGEADETNAALDALEAALAGAQDFDAYFGDLVERDRLRAGTAPEPSR